MLVSRKQLPPCDVRAEGAPADAHVAMEMSKSSALILMITYIVAAVADGSMMVWCVQRGYCRSIWRGCSISTAKAR